MKRFSVFLCYCLLFFLAPPKSVAHEILSSEFVKASYLINLSQFVSWEKRKHPIEICVIGTNDINAQLTQIAINANLEDVLEIQSKDWSSSFDSCSILYISETAEIKLPQILYKTSSYPILTVSDIENFISQNGAIGFVETDGTIKIEINNSLLLKKGISVNSELLEIARKVI